MQIAIIPPKAYTEMAAGDYHLILPQLIETKKRSAYRLFYKEVEGYKILDNGAAEGAMVAPAHLMEVARDLAVDEVVVPDILGDAAMTYRLAREFNNVANSYDWLKFTGVVQGRDRAEIVQSIHLFMDLEYISVLAVPRHLCQKVSKYVRYDIVNALHDELAERFEAVHFLGSSSWIKEPVLLSDLPIARGMDTSLPVYMGMSGKTLYDSWQPRPKGYFNSGHIGLAKEEIIYDNIRRYRDWAT